MTESTRMGRAAAHDELRRDARREYLLLVQAAVGLIVIAAIVWVRQAFFA